MPIAHPGHNRVQGQSTDSWITPRWLLDRLGPFDLDPCACIPQPWPTATVMLTEKEDGLMSPWPKDSFVFMNPPYLRTTIGAWFNRMALHNRGIALVFARTEIEAFQKYVWPFSTKLLFLKKRLNFFKPDGTPGGKNSGAPSVLIAYGEEATQRLQQCRDLGALVTPDR